MNAELRDVLRFRKKPVVIEAMQYDGTEACASEIARWANAGDEAAGHEDPTITYLVGGHIPPGYADDMIVQTMEGGLSASVGDWIIRGVAGEFYPCKPDIFAATYEPEHGPVVPDGDGERLDWLEARRVALTPEFEGPWLAEVFGDDAYPARCAHGNSVRAAIDAARSAAQEK